MSKNRSCKTCGYRDRLLHEQPCKPCIEEGCGGFPLWEEKTGIYNNYEGKLFRLNRNANGLKKDTLVKVVIAGNYSCKLREHPSGTFLGISFSYEWLDPADDV